MPKNINQNCFRRVHCSAAVFVLSLATITSAQKGYERKIKGDWFYDPVTDPIPWNPENNKHGPDYDIPDDEWKIEADKRIDTYRKSPPPLRHLIARLEQNSSSRCSMKY